MTHELKCWPRFFWDIATEQKTFDVRRWDRRFMVGDEVLLREWFPTTQEYGGRDVRRTIVYVQPGGQFGVDPGYCVLGLRRDPGQV